ncbi:MAG TPA: STAS domain-containing protein [Mycobacteriales bacterium]|nr:STAS domain-containing protein [Mycobacteriales bacterium]
MIYARPLQVDVEPGAPVVVRPHGDVDANCADALRETLLAQVRASDVALDLSAVGFIDSPGVSVLVTAHRTACAAGHRFAIRGADGVVLKVLHAMGLEQVLPLER